MNELRRTGLGIAAISYDAVPILADFSKRRGITFPLLSDPGSLVIKAYGILNTTVPETNRQQFGIPFPGTFMLDRAGIVTSRYFEQAYQERTTMSTVMARLGQSTGARATRARAPYLELTTYLTDAAAAPGTRFSVVVDVRPASKVHVYAPGVEGYKPVALRIDPQPGLLVRSAQFPAPEDYYFAPLNEHVAVYSRPFRIMQDVMIDPSAQAAPALSSATSLTIRGALDYQACNDTECFLPQTLPLSWTIALKPLDRERAQTPR